VKTHYLSKFGIFVHFLLPGTIIFIDDMLKYSLIDIKNQGLKEDKNLQRVAMVSLDIFPVYSVLEYLLLKEGFRLDFQTLYSFFNKKMWKKEEEELDYYFEFIEDDEEDRVLTRKRLANFSMWSGSIFVFGMAVNNINKFCLDGLERYNLFNWLIKPVN